MVLDGVFFDLISSAAEMKDWRQRLIASCAMSSNIAGYVCTSQHHSKQPEGTHTLTKSCSCESTHIVLRSVGNQVSCLSNDGSWNSWLMLSFSLISSPVSGFLAA